MSSLALAYDFSGDIHRSRRQQRVVRAALPWSEVPLVRHALSQERRKVPSYVWGLAAIAIAVHAALAWYATHSQATQPVAPHKHEVALELVRPPVPKPKVEPPQPLPPKPKTEVKRAQTLPPIQTTAPAPSAPTQDAVAESVVAVEPVVSAPVEPAPEPVTAPVGHAGYLNNPPPDYPSIAVRQRWQGTVLLRVRVLSNGTVDAIEVAESSGRRILDEQAARTVKNWLFTPSKRGDTAIDGWATVPIEFKLDT